MISRRQSTCLNFKNKSVSFAQDKDKNSSHQNTNNNREKIISGGIALSSTLAGTGIGYALYKKDKVDLKKMLEKLKNELIRTTKAEIDNSNVINKIKANFTDLIEREKSGKITDIPNCLMIEGKSPKLTQELIDWTGKNSNCRFIKINAENGILKELEKCEEYYEKTGKRTLIHKENLDKLLNPKLFDSSSIAALKDIMCSASEDYHPTIIFSSTDPSKLDQIALQPHRVIRINANISKEELNKLNNATKRLESLEKKFKELSRSKSKILIGLGAGLTIGTLGTCLSHLIFKSKKDKTKFKYEKN